MEILDNKKEKLLDLIISKYKSKNSLKARGVRGKEVKKIDKEIEIVIDDYINEYIKEH